MKTLAIKVSDTLAKKLKGLVDSGWFGSEDEIGRVALAEFVGRHRFELQEKFQRDDIAWALSQKTGERKSG